MANVSNNVIIFPPVKDNFGILYEQTDLGNYTKAIYSIEDRIFIANDNLTEDEIMRLFKKFYNDIRKKCTDC
ncbi:MAG: hypothetical protein ACFFC6_11280 [Promethearchaeota archaeon]